MKHIAVNTKNYNVDWWDTDKPSITVYNQDADTELGNFTGLYNNKGQPLFRSKEKIGFKIGLK